MVLKNKQEPFILFIGDGLVFILSLWLTLGIRYGEVPSMERWDSHLGAFSVLFGVSFLTFLIAGLYEKQTSTWQSKLPSTLLYTQLSNVIIAILFFYFIPFFGITPKTNLFIYLAVSTSLLFLWRIYGVRFFNLGQKEKIAIIGTTNEMAELVAELSKNKRYKSIIEASIDIDKVSDEELSNFFENLSSKSISLIIADTDHPKMSHIMSKHYDALLFNINVLNIHTVYEHIYDRVALNSINYSWLTYINRRSVVFYDAFKRLMDLFIAGIMIIITFPFFPFVAILIRLEGKGPIFITQNRVGKGGKKISMYKFRTMLYSDEGVWLSESENRVTEIGRLLRKTRIDELPQLINVIKGDISLIGPRPDIGGLGEKLVNEIPYYMTRYAVLPGLSGWAQIQQVKPPQSLDETRMRFAYDLYYIKNRSFILDVRIALRTIYILLSRTGM